MSSFPNWGLDDSLWLWQKLIITEIDIMGLGHVECAASAACYTNANSFSESPGFTRCVCVMRLFEGEIGYVLCFFYFFFSREGSSDNLRKTFGGCVFIQEGNTRPLTVRPRKEFYFFMNHPVWTENTDGAFPCSS